MTPTVSYRLTAGTPGVERFGCRKGVVPEWYTVPRDDSGMCEVDHLIGGGVPVHDWGHPTQNSKRVPVGPSLSP